MATIYVMGAGASRHVGYPLAADMGRELIDFMLSSPDSTGRIYAEYLVDKFGVPSNFEDLITELQDRLEALKDSHPASEARKEYLRLGTRLGYLSTSLREWFYGIRCNPAPAYSQFADLIVKSGDVIVTFNYDDSLDRELRRAGKWDVSQGYGFQLGLDERPSDVQLLKLHGSINWLVSVFGGATPASGVFAVANWSSLGDHPVIHNADLDFLGYKDFSGFTYKSGGAFPCLILPGRSKRFYYDTSLGREYSDFWDLLWRQAMFRIKRAEKMVICGYSLLPVDERACDLLLNAPRKDTPVTVISGSQSERIATDFETLDFSR
jgi:hypothetical protein